MSNALSDVAMLVGSVTALIGLTSTDPMTVAVGLFGGLAMGMTGVMIRFGPPARQ